MSVEWKPSKESTRPIVVGFVYKAPAALTVAELEKLL
jgi:hypothetical protein